ncbi:hypothetical protein MNBD_GAMMA18-1072 [hydrothermal vent metagenome]|uniref:Uncharacterized protein n=1 Tax=hydrothermal vent metagenome TaxID=652676 RepID=A0A3B0Z9P7_9ZZZZ
MDSPLVEASVSGKVLISKRFKLLIDKLELGCIIRPSNRETRTLFKKLIK